VDGILQGQSRADADYFASIIDRPLTEAQQEALRAAVLKAYRWQYIVTGVQEPRFQQVLGSLIDAQQSARIGQALAPLLA
jgi:hypothetical protein